MNSSATFEQTYTFSYRIPRIPPVAASEEMTSKFTEKTAESHQGTQLGNVVFFEYI